MRNAISDLNTLLSSMTPTLNEGAYAFISVPHANISTTLSQIPSDALIGSFRESEGMTLILSEAAAHACNQPILFRAAWISLTVHSDLAAVGLTAAFAHALGAAQISCNVIAAAFHDHIFVPMEEAQRAMQVLRQLQHDALMYNEP